MKLKQLHNKIIHVCRRYDFIFRQPHKNCQKCEFNKFSGQKVNTQKSVTFLHTNNKLSEKEIKKQYNLP